MYIYQARLFNTIYYLHFDLSKKTTVYKYYLFLNVFVLKNERCVFIVRIQNICRCQ